MALSELCDMCGREVEAADAIRAEMATVELMCPVSMTMHAACYQRAADLWHVASDSESGVLGACKSDGT